jgi:hypothetical protein
LIYPASVVKLFYLVAAYEGFAQGELQRSSELDRALQDMIVDSSNDATGLVMDMVTETTSGPELPPEAFALWQQRRNQVNDWIRTWGWPELAQVNMNQKTWKIAITSQQMPQPDWFTAWFKGRWFLWRLAKKCWGSWRDRWIPKISQPIQKIK